METSANLFTESPFLMFLVICSISEAIDIGDKIGRNRVNQELLREQSSIRQSLKNREDLQQIYSEVHLDSFKVSKSCMIDRYYTQLFAADTSNSPGNDVYISLVTFLWIDPFVCIPTPFALLVLLLATSFSSRERSV